MTRARDARPCFRCHEPKLADAFPMGRSGKRHSSVCWACTEEEAYRRLARAMAYWATWTDPKTGRIVRRCAGCGEVKDLETGFYHSAPALPGSWWPRNAPCRPCSDQRKRDWAKAHPEADRAYRRKSAKRSRQRNPEAARARNRRQWEKIKADPARHAKIREDGRINYRLRRAKAGKPVTRKRLATVTQKREPSRRIPAAPLGKLVMDVIGQRAAAAHAGYSVEPALEDLCREWGVSSRSVRRWRGQAGTTVKIGVAERVLLAAEVEWHEVYPPEQARDFLVTA